MDRPRFAASLILAIVAAVGFGFILLLVALVAAAYELLDAIGDHRIPFKWLTG
jgi:hypothetical protein